MAAVRPGSPSAPSTLRRDELAWTEPPTASGNPGETVAPLDRLVLIRMEGAEAGRSFELGDQGVSIGRDRGNDIVVDDSCVSRRHARVTVTRVAGAESRAFIEDLHSQNGTYLGGQRVQYGELRAGDLVHLGERVGFSFQRLNRAHQRLLVQMYDSSTRDALTGATNRRHFDDRLASEIAFSKRHGTPVGLVLLDIDHFKRVNDAHGHSAGDAVLRQVAHRMAIQLRREDVFARVGGEEFAIVLRGIDLDGCYCAAERLRESIAKDPFPVGDVSLPVTVSAGCASLRGGDAGASALLAMADERLYEAKRLGRNRSVRSTPARPAGKAPPEPGEGEV